MMTLSAEQPPVQIAPEVEVALERLKLVYAMGEILSKKGVVDNSVINNVIQRLRLKPQRTLGIRSSGQGYLENKSDTNEATRPYFGPQDRQQWTALPA